MATERCPACEKGRLEPFISIPSVPVYCNVLWESRSKALAAPRGEMSLGFCRQCALLYNMSFEPSLVEYGLAYENSLHGSPRFQVYAEKLADALVAQHDLWGKDIVEIGCGKGEFLELLCRNGRNRGHGFDASYDGRVDDLAGGNIEIVRDYYSAKYVDTPADLILSRHVLEHIQEPAQFVRQIRQAALQAGCPAVFTEVPDGMWTLRDLGIWDLIYEHCSYFTAPSLEALFARNGFEPAAATSAFGGQFLCLAASVLDQESAPPERASEVDEVAELVAGFADHYQKKIAKWSDHLAQVHRAGKRTGIWGVGSKGVTFLNLLPEGKNVLAAVDINDQKRGRFIPGTGQEVVEPEALVELGIDFLIVMNPLYQDEIESRLASLGLDIEVVSA